MCAVCATPIMGHWKFWQVVQVHRRKEDKMNDTISTTKSIDGDFIKKNIKVPAKCPASLHPDENNNPAGKSLVENYASGYPQS